MKKNSLLILFIITATGLFAQASGHEFSLGVHFGLLSGQAEEIVYMKSSNKSNDKLSQLLWDMKPLAYAGVDINYNWQNPDGKWGIFTDALFKFGFPMETGIMEDRDWTDNGRADHLTHYSVHYNRTKQAILIDVNAGASFKIFNTFQLRPFLSYSYMNFSWAASGGSLLYPAKDGDLGFYEKKTDVITYGQTWNIIAVGISFYGAFNRYFNADISFKVSPFIWCTALDNHIMRNLIISENIFGGFLFEPGLLFSFTPNDFFKLSLSVTYRNISGTRGNSVYKEGGQTQSGIPKNIGGAGYSVFDTGLLVSFKIIPGGGGGTNR